VWSQGEGTNGPGPGLGKGEGPGKAEGRGTRGNGAEGVGVGEDNMAVVRTGVGRVGGLICWESECGVRFRSRRSGAAGCLVGGEMRADKSF
jgi:hypothetical protein